MSNSWRVYLVARGNAQVMTTSPPTLAPTPRCRRPLRLRRSVIDRVLDPATGAEDGSVAAASRGRGGRRRGRAGRGPGWAGPRAAPAALRCTRPPRTCERTRTVSAEIRMHGHRPAARGLPCGGRVAALLLQEAATVVPLDPVGPSAATSSPSTWSGGAARRRRGHHALERPGGRLGGLLAAALVTGNAVVYKPCERSPLTGDALARRCTALPGRRLTLVQRRRERRRGAGRAADVDAVAHVGSSSTGRRIAVAGRAPRRSCWRTAARMR